MPTSDTLAFEIEASGRGLELIGAPVPDPKDPKKLHWIAPARYEGRDIGATLSVALQAIRSLKTITDQQRARIEALEAKNAETDQELINVDGRLKALEKAIGLSR